MRVNQTYRSLLDKSISSFLSAIEIFNKPNFVYREETFSILTINAWELLFKAQLLKISSYNIKSLYILEPVIKKDGTPHKINKLPKLNRSKNPLTIGLFDAIKNLENAGFKLTNNHLASLEALIELRDNAIHFYNDDLVSKEILELGFASIKNYIQIIKKWKLDIDLSKYNFYLMPLAYVDSRVISDGIITDEVKNYLNFIKSKLDSQDQNDIDFDIAISIEVNFKKSNSFNAIGINYDPNGIPITLAEEDIRKKFPLTDKKVKEEAKQRYEDFKQNKKFNMILQDIKKDEKLYHERKLDPENPKSSKKPYYNTNIWKVLDNHYIKK